MAWQLASLPNSPQYCHCTPTECSPFLGRTVSSKQSTPCLGSEPARRSIRAIRFWSKGGRAPGAIDQEVLELFQAGGGQDFGDALGILAGQVRDQAEEVMGAVLDAALA